MEPCWWKFPYFRLPSSLASAQLLDVDSCFCFDLSSSGLSSILSSEYGTVCRIRHDLDSDVDSCGKTTSSEQAFGFGMAVRASSTCDEISVNGDRHGFFSAFSSQEHLEPIAWSGSAHAFFSSSESGAKLVPQAFHPNAWWCPAWMQTAKSTRQRFTMHHRP